MDCAFFAQPRRVLPSRENSEMKFTNVISQSFSTAQVARLTGLTPRQLDHWDRLGFVRPSVRKASGYGSARRYSFGDVVRLRVAARLRVAGLGLSRIRRCAQALTRLGGEPGGLGGVRLIVAGPRVFWARSDSEVVDLLKEGQLVLVFSVGDAVEETRGAVDRLSQEDAAAERSEHREKRIF
jgi:DNA-binding transcriptional MerR regulator